MKHDFGSAIFLGSFLTLVGTVVSMIVNREVGPIFVATILLILGIAATAWLTRRNVQGIRAFVLSFGVCAFFIGINQLYAVYFFGRLQTTVDAEITFYPMVSGGLIYAEMATLEGMVNSPLAVMIYQAFYQLCQDLGLGNSPWIGLTLNAFLVGLSAAITNSIGRLIWRENTRRLNRLGSLFALCGMFVLYGSILVRDSFTLFINVCALWIVIRCVLQPSIKNIGLAALIIPILILSMRLVRSGNVVIFIMLGFAVLAGTIKRIEYLRVLTFSLLGVVLPIAIYLYSPSLLSDFLDKVENYSKSYQEMATATADSTSLGMAFLINQPKIVRAALGSGSMLVNPIPLWAGFSFDLGEYSWIQGFSGLFVVWILPLAVVGMIQSYSEWKYRPQAVNVSIMLVAYFAFGLLGTAVTSLETRHFGQFLPVLLIFASIPELTVKRTRQKWLQVSRLWFGLILTVHLVYLSIKWI